MGQTIKPESEDIMTPANLSLESGCRNRSRERNRPDTQHAVVICPQTIRSKCVTSRKISSFAGEESLKPIRAGSRVLHVAGNERRRRRAGASHYFTMRRSPAQRRL